jgi:hypothetical protein
MSVISVSFSALSALDSEDVFLFCIRLSLTQRLYIAFGYIVFGLTRRMIFALLCTIFDVSRDPRITGFTHLMNEKPCQNLV